MDEQPDSSLNILLSINPSDINPNICRLNTHYILLIVNTITILMKNSGLSDKLCGRLLWRHQVIQSNSKDVGSLLFRNNQRKRAQIFRCNHRPHQSRTTGWISESVSMDLTGPIRDSPNIQQNVCIFWSCGIWQSCLSGIQNNGDTVSLQLQTLKTGKLT